MPEKKIDLRDIGYEELASALMSQREHLNIIKRHKEGLVFDVNGETVVLRMVLKKKELDEKAWRGEYFHDEKLNQFGYRAYSPTK